MKNILMNLKINNLTYILLFVCALTGMFKSILLIFLIILIHEFGHVFFIKKFGYEIKSIELYPFGGITKIEKDLNSPINSDLVIACGGFIFQLFLLIIFFTMFKLNIINEITFNLFNTYNKAILVFNLLPIIPLDGYIILKSILEKYLTFKKTNILTIIISVIGIIFYFQYNYVYSVNNYMIITLLIYKTYITFKNRKFIYNRFLLERYLNFYPYKKTKQEKIINFQNFKKETLHFFKVGNRYVHEREILKKKFDKKSLL